MNKKGEGLILSMIIGVAFLVTTIIIAFVVVSNVATIESEIASRISVSISNESGVISNTTGYTVIGASKTGFLNPVLVRVYNSTSGLAVNIANYTMSSLGVIRNTTEGANFTGDIAYLISYNYDYKVTTVSTEGLRSNFTKGIDNVSSKIPTVLLIAAVVLILGVLVLLWTQYKKMDVGSGGGL